MNNVLYGIKRFFKNKNTVTILAIVLSIVIIYYAYNARIKKATEPRAVPYAVANIEPRTLITNEMIETRKVPGSVITPNVITNTSEILGKYVSNEVEIPADSLFYKGTLLTWDELPSSIYGNIKEGEAVVALPVDMEKTYGNSIYPGNYIDLYFSTTVDGKVLVGKFIESIKVEVVTDSSFNNIFEKTEDMEQPAYLIFFVPEYYHKLLKKATKLGVGDIFPVPRNAEYSKNPKPTRIVSAYIENLILQRTITIGDDTDSDSTIKDIPTNNNSGGGN